MTAILIFKCTEGADVGNYSSKGRGARKKNGFGTHARWQPVTQSAGSRQSYGKIEDCEQSCLGFLGEEVRVLGRTFSITLKRF